MRQSRRTRGGWQGGGNYYITRANGLEDNLTIYHIVKSRRASFKNVDMKVAPDTWHTLRVGFDGKFVLDATDDTFMKAGAVGIWTKADSGGAV
jgi:hypothetical protein